MKRLTLLLIAAVALFGCEKPEPEAVKKTQIVTFEDSSFASGDGESSGTVTSAWWSQYIDTPQYGGNKLYGGNGYAWYDNKTTLTSYLPDPWNDGTFYGGGIAISNYVENPTEPTFEHQLTIGVQPVSGRNFAICYVATNEQPPFIEVKYGTGVIESLYVLSTVYGNAVVQKGNAFSPAMPTNGYIRITATGIDAEGNKTGEEKMFLYNGPYATGWRKWNLSALGVVKRVEFRMYEGVRENGVEVDSTAEYPTYPSYFAIDDIAVTR